MTCPACNTMLNADGRCFNRHCEKFNTFYYVERLVKSGGRDYRIDIQYGAVTVFEDGWLVAEWLYESREARWFRAPPKQKVLPEKVNEALRAAAALILAAPQLPEVR